MGATKDRMDFRLERTVKQRIERAATLTGQTVSAFAVSALMREANSILAEHEAIVLNADASRKFLARLDKDIKPNQNLRRAAKRHKELVA
jgi:uncharacterized protein (DUF1778 family)